MPFHIHPVMKDSDNLNSASGYLAVENNVSSGTVFSVTGPDFAPILAFQGFIRQVMKTLIQHRQVGIPQQPTPSFLGVSANGFQIRLSGLGEVETGH